MASVPATYKAYVYESFGKIEDVLKIATVLTEPLPATHVRIRVQSAAINPIEYKIIEFLREKFAGGSPSADKPFRVGYDVAGIVAEVGGGVKDFKIGDHVFSKGAVKASGSLAQFFSVDEQFVAIKPKSIDFDHAAGVPLVSMASFYSLVHVAKLQPGETIVVLGGTTSTGMFAIQYAKSIGARVVATTSTQNVPLVQSLGADVVVDYKSQTWTDVVPAHSVDVVFDNFVDPASWDADAQTALRKETGRFVTLNPLYKQGPSKFGASYTSVASNPMTGKDLAHVATLIDDGKIKTFVDSTYAFEDVAAAYLRSKTGRAVGKIVIKVDESANA